MANEGAQGAGDGAPAGDPKDGSGKFVPPSDGSWIPKVRHDEAVNAERGRVSRLEAEIAALRLAQQKQPVHDEEPAKRYTRAELDAAVTAQTITAEQREEVWAKQIREDAKREAKAEVLGTVRAERQQERVETDLNEYKALAPEIMEEGSETRQRIHEEFQYLIGLGDPGGQNDPRTLQTQLKAIRAVLGPVDKLRTAKSARRETEAHEETGGSSGGASGRTRSAPKTGWDSLDKRQKDYYDAKISAGLYKDRAAVEAELKFSRTANSPRKAGARA